MKISGTAQVRCPSRGLEQGCRLVQSIDMRTDPASKRLLLAGELNLLACRCGKRTQLAANVLFHDPDANFFCHVVPGGEAAMAKAVEAFRAAGVTGTQRLVPSINALVEKVKVLDAALEDWVIEMSKVLLLASLGDGELGRMLLFAGIDRDAQELGWCCSTNTVAIHCRCRARWPRTSVSRRERTASPRAMRGIRAAGVGRTAAARRSRTPRHLLRARRLRCQDDVLAAHHLATLIPPPRSHLTRYHGVFAPHHALRAAVVPSDSSASEDAGSRAGPLRRLAWAALMKRVFAIDVLVCDTCGGAMRILAVIPDGNTSRAILQHLGLPTEPPDPCALAPPPWFDNA